MMNDKEFADKVWEKHQRYINSNEKDPYFSKHQYKTNNTYKKLRLLFNVILGFALTAGIVYASIKGYDFIQNNTSFDYKQNTGYDISKEMLNSNGLYYTKIYTYEDYINEKESYSNFIELEEADFKDNFLLIITGENYRTTNLHISNIYADAQTMFIELRRNTTYDEKNTHIAAKIPKDLDREKVEINNIPNIINTPEHFTNINNIDVNYTEEQAILEGCLVIKEHKIISHNGNVLDEFIENYKNGKEGFLRIYRVDIAGIKIIFDIENKNGAMNLSWRCINGEDNEIYYRTGNRIIKFEEIINEKVNTYVFMDQIENQMILCSIEV